MKTTNYSLMTDVERQATDVLKYTPTNTWKERFGEFMDYYFGPLKLYLLSYPMPDGMWNNRKWRLKASGVQVIARREPPKTVDRLVIIQQKQPHSDKKI